MIKKRIRVRPLDLLLILLIGLPFVASSLASGATTVAVTVSLPPAPDTNPVVAIIHRQSPPDTAEVATMVREAVTAVLGPSELAALVASGDTVVIKPNLGVGHATHQTTDWTVVAPLAEMAWAAGASRVVIAEGQGPDFAGTGYLDNMPPGTEFVDLSAVSDFYDVTVKGGYWSEPIIIPQLYFDADVVITVPAFKTHHNNAGVTIGLKNAVGVLPVTPYSSGPSITWRDLLHDEYGIHGTIPQINLARQPDLVVVDGLEGCEGEGPWGCSSVQMNLILAALDTVALDTVGTEIMGCEFCEPRRIAHQVYAAYKNLGVNDLAAIQVVGTPIEQVQQAFASPANPEEIYRATVVIEATGRPLTVDGDLGDLIGVRPIDLDDEAMVQIGRGGWTGLDDLSATARALYDSEALHVAVAVRDDVKLANTASPTWDGDGVELYINGRDPWDVAFSHLSGGDEFWLGVVYGPSPTVWDIGRDQALGGAEVALVDTADGYIVELRIPWAALSDFQALEHRQIGFDLGLNDDDTGDGRETWLSWGGTEEPPGSSAQWGVARLGALHVPIQLWLPLLCLSR